VLTRTGEWPGCLVNARFRKQKITGVQRVAVELSARMTTCTRFIEPAGSLHGPLGHAWEQFVLPVKAAGGLLWSPCNTGPVAVRNQIVTVHDAAVFDHPEWFAADFVRVYHAVIPRLIRRVRKVVTVSSYSRSRLIDRFGLEPDKVEVVYNGVGAAFQPRDADEIAAAVAPFGLEPQRYFIAVATREPRKNQDLILRAWGSVVESIGPGFKLVLVGGRGSRAVFANNANDLPGSEPAGVVTTGYVADDVLPALMSGAAAMLYPSLYEGFGLPLLEAMACGTPSITTRLTSMPEVAGTSAIYVDPEDASDLASQLRRLAADGAYREAFGAAGRERASTFTWTQAAIQMDDIVRSCR
jgi:glycosyltransferase involved in cell wall biosynthesis